MITARELVSGRFVRIGEAHSLAEAIGIMFDPGAATLRELVVVVLDADGNYLGLVEPRDILESFGTDLSAAGTDPAAQVAAIRRRLKSQVMEIARRDIPAVRLDDSLAALLGAAARAESAALPVFDQGQFVGVVP
ncbi:MAG: CBS domain-containing protein, partial [Terrimicrobiaceae bacterium]|nr:CBS domain-containing protein [Terrimicrobiaceae bacterium]